MVIADGSVSLPLPWNSTVILLLARPGPEPSEIVQSSTAQPGISRSITEPAPGRICSTKENYGSPVASPFAGISGVQV